MHIDESIIVLDFGSQYTQLIARRVRECGVYCSILPYNTTAAELSEIAPRAIIFSGGPNSVGPASEFMADKAIFDMGIPLLGICYGMQMMAQQHGGKITPSYKAEYGKTVLQCNNTCVLFSDIDTSGNVWMSHGDQVTSLPEEFITVAKTDSVACAAMAHKSKPWYALQFHPEVSHTEQGMAMLKRFVIDVAGCSGTWQTGHIAEELIADMRAEIGDGHVVLGLSGGVDSSVVAALLHKAIGKNLHCVFVDNGLLRQGEVEQVKAVFQDHFGINLNCVDARSQFMQALAGITEPEQKRKIIGELFVRIFEKEAIASGDAKFLAQGTIYPDVIESAGHGKDQAHVIKSHHNVGGLPEDMHLKLVEPLASLFKDEVRELGRHLGLPDSLVFRHPFPGPGLAIRIMGEVSEERLDILRRADAIYQEILHQSGWYHRLGQAFAVFLPVQSVGVVGDQRHYAYVLALRAVVTSDFMTAHWADLPYDVLAEASSRIVNEVPEVTRVVYDITTKPPATIEWE